MLRQAVREMERLVADAESETAKVLANETRMARDLARNERQAQDWHNRAEMSVAAADDALALKALVRRKQYQKLASDLENQLSAIRDAGHTLRGQLEFMQTRLAEAKRELATITARKRAADFKKKLHSTAVGVEAGSCTDQAFARFERLRERVEQTEAEADALANLRRAKFAANETAQLESAAPDDLRRELESLKIKRRGASEG